ncbi:MAG: hypothetical protein SGPRY_008534 [Prymnesium sp.]
MGWEWRLFYRPHESCEAVHSELEAASAQARTDIYYPHSKEIGLKARGGTNDLELKHRKEAADGWEKWKKRRCQSVEEVGEVILELTGQSTAVTLDKHVTVAKSRRQAMLGMVLLEQTELLVSVGIGPQQLWQTVALEGKRKQCAPMLGPITEACKRNAINGDVRCCGYPEFVLNLQPGALANAGESPDN